MDGDTFTRVNRAVERFLGNHHVLAALDNLVFHEIKVHVAFGVDKALALTDIPEFAQHIAADQYFGVFDTAPHLKIAAALHFEPGRYIAGHDHRLCIFDVSR